MKHWVRNSGREWIDPLARLGSNWLFVPIKLECWEKLGISQEAGSDVEWIARSSGMVCYWRYIGDTRRRMESIWRLLEISPRECRVTQDWRLHGFEDIDNRLLVSESYWNKMNIVMVRELSVGVQRGNQHQELDICFPGNHCVAALKPDNIVVGVIWLHWPHTSDSSVVTLTHDVVVSDIPGDPGP